MGITVCMCICACVYMHVCVCVFLSLAVLRVSISVWLYISNIRISMPEAGCHEGTCSGFLVHLCGAPPCISGWVSAEIGIRLPWLHLQCKWVRTQPDL